MNQSHPFKSDYVLQSLKTNLVNLVKSFAREGVQTSTIFYWVDRSGHQSKLQLDFNTRGGMVEVDILKDGLWQYCAFNDVTSIADELWNEIFTY